MRRAATLSVSLNTPFDLVWEFISDVQNLHLWTVEFALESPQKRGDRFEVKTPRGMLELSVRADRASGVIDFVIGAGGRRNIAPSRLLPNDNGCIYIFTQFEPIDAPAGLFERLVENVKKELQILAKRFGSPSSE